MSRRVGVLSPAARFLLPAWPVLLLCLVCGCASPRGADLSGFAADFLEDAEEGVDLGPDAPDSPGAGLPSLEALSKEGLIADGEEDITIQRDTLLSIVVREDPVLSGAYPVNELGAIQFGYVGPVFLYNKTVKQAEDKIRALLERRYLRQATVTVRMQRASYEKVWVSGSVLKPGPLKIGAGDTISLNDALLRAGGLKVPVRRAKVRIIRGGLLTAVWQALPGELYTLVNEKSEPEVPDIGLGNNDIAFVYREATKREARKDGPGSKTVLVLGEVKQEGYVTFGAGEGCTIMHLIFKMAGLPPYANDKAIRIIRRDADGIDSEIKVNARRILKEGNPDFDVPLENRDRVIVPARRISLF